MKKFDGYIEIISAVLIFVIMQPYYIWGIDVVPFKFLLYLIFFFNLKIKNFIERCLFLLLFITYSIIPIVHDNNLFGFLEFVLLAMIPFLKVSYAKRVYKNFSMIYTSLMAVSLVVWVAVVIGLPVPGHTIEPLNQLKTATYTAYPFLITIFDFNNIRDVFRFCSVFDEPGVVGTVSLILLYINGFKMKEKGNIILLISGIASFSLFFYIGSLIYLLLVLYRNKGRVKTKAFVIVASIGFFIAVMNIPVLYDMVGYRLEIDTKKGTIVGDNRAHDDLLDYFPKIRGTSKYYWGDSVDRVQEFAGSAGYRNVILRYGAVFLFLFIIFWLLYSFHLCKRDKYTLLVFWTLMIATLYQRPGVTSINYIFLFAVFFKMHVPDYFLDRIRLSRGSD